MIDTLKQLQSENIDEVEQALSFIVDHNDRKLIPHLIERLKSTSDANVRNAISMALSDLQANEAVPELLKLIADPKNEGYTGTLLYALQGLNCEGYFLDLIKILSTGNFESSEMALELIEKYADDVDYATKLQALNFLKEQETNLNSGPSNEAGKFDRINYVHHALELLKD